MFAAFGQTKPIRLKRILIINTLQGHATGGSFNPARSLAPAIWTNDFTSHWVNV